MSRGAARAVAAVLAVMAAVVGLAGPAAAEGEVVVSPDGTTWSQQLSGPLFDPAERWVPGDVRIRRFWVGSRAPDAGVLAVVATADDADGLLARREIVLDVRRLHGTWVRVPADGQPHALPGVLPAGAEGKLEVRASFVPAADNPSQVRRLPFALTVVLSGDPAVAPPDGGGSGGDGLPGTGGVDLRLLLAGLLLAAVGALVMVTAAAPVPGSRKKDHDDAHD